MTGPVSDRAVRQRKAKEMYASGATMKEIADAFGVTPPAVRYWLRVQLDLEKQTAQQDKLHTRIITAYQQGNTMAAIGAGLGISGERVRQILKEYGIVGVPRISRQPERREAAQKRKEARVARLWGLSWEDYRQLCDRYGTSEAPMSPFRKYIQQRKNAKSRGIKWSITFAEWWGVWQASGKWSARGRGDGYCMARFGDKGPYKVGNVEIMPTRENSRQARLKTLTKTF